MKQLLLPQVEDHAAPLVGPGKSTFAEQVVAMEADAQHRLFAAVRLPGERIEHFLVRMRSEAEAK